MVDQGLTSCMAMAYTPCYSHINGNMIVDAEISLMDNYLRIYTFDTYLWVVEKCCQDHLAGACLGH